MKRINNIVVSNTEPSVNSLWITNNTIKWFGKSGWEGLDFTDNTKLWNAINQEISDRQEEDDYIKKNALKNSQIRMSGFSRDDEYWIRYTCTNKTISNHSFGLDQNLVINTASSTENGMMSFSDKVKLDSIDATTLVNTVDGLIPAAYLPSYVDDVLEYSSVDTFPETGEAGKIYVDTTTNLTYRWTGTQYIEISKSLGLGETASAAYPGDKGKQNADNIATLQTQVGSNNFSSSNYLSKETNVTDALLQLDEEIKATNDNLDLEHANAEATYAKKTDLSGYLPLSGGTMTLTPDDIRESNHISFNIKNYDVPHIELTGKGIDEAACLIAEAGHVEVCGYLPEGPGYRHWAQLDRDGVHLYNEYYTPGSATFTRSGVTIDGKTTSDLLNAGGSTTSVSDITTQVQAAIVDSAPETLDTLNELAAALGDDPNFATTVTNQIASKQDKLVSGTNIKTINGQTLLGEGDIDLSGSVTTDDLSGYLKVPTLVETGSADWRGWYQIIGKADQNNTFIGGLEYNPGNSQLRIGKTAERPDRYIQISSNPNGASIPSIYLCDSDASGSNGFLRLSCIGNCKVSIDDNSGFNIRVQEEDNGTTQDTLIICTDGMGWNSLRPGAWGSYVHRMNNYIDKNGVKLNGKTSSDLLHAAGGTISINDLKTQIISDLSAQVSTLQTQIAELTSRIEALENA